MGFFNIFGGTKDKELIDQALANGTPIVDVRSPGEYRMGHVKNSINIPLDTVPNKLEKFKKMQQPFILVCASGNRSGNATAFLKGQGIECANGGSWSSYR